MASFDIFVLRDQCVKPRHAIINYDPPFSSTPWMWWWKKCCERSVYARINEMRLSHKPSSSSLTVSCLDIKLEFELPSCGLIKISRLRKWVWRRHWNVDLCSLDFGNNFAQWKTSWCRVKTEIIHQNWPWKNCSKWWDEMMAQNVPLWYLWLWPIMKWGNNQSTSLFVELLKRSYWIHELDRLLVHWCWSFASDQRKMQQDGWANSH